MVVVVYRNYCYVQCVSIYCVDKIFGISIDCFVQYCCWQIISIIFDKVVWFFLCCDYVVKYFCCFIVIQYCLQFCVCFGIVCCQFVGDQYFYIQCYCYVEQVWVVVFVGQELYCFVNFNGVVGVGGQYLIYIGQQCGGVYVGVVGDIYDCFGQCGREFISWYKCVVVDFDVYYQCIQFFCQFFCQN